jgi:hypothetical protein
MKSLLPGVVMTAFFAFGCEDPPTGEGEGEGNVGEGEGDVGEGEGDAGEGEGEGEPIYQFRCGTMDAISLFQCGPDSDYVAGEIDVTLPDENGVCTLTIGLDNGVSGSGTTPDAALAAVDCKSECVWRANNAVSFIYCGSRNEYFSYVDDRGICDDVYSFPPQGDESFSDAVVPADLDAWLADHPCP